MERRRNFSRSPVHMRISNALRRGMGGIHSAGLHPNPGKLQDILGTLLIVDTLDDKLLEFYIELLPHVLRSDDHYQNLPLL